MRRNIFLFISILLLILSTGCSDNSSIEENIGITKAKKEFIVEFNNWTGKETHNMYLHSGEIVNVTIENEGGERLYVQVSNVSYIGKKSI